MAISLPKITRMKKRLGRGVGSRGAKSGRGQKGQKSRAGFSRKTGFEGGQTPLYMRLPKGKGTKQKFRSQVKKPIALAITQLVVFKDGDVIGPGVLRKQGFLPSRYSRIKLVGSGTCPRKLTVRVHSTSVAAKKAVEDAGGKVEMIQS